MNKDEAKKIIKDVFTNKFDEKGFETFISNLFNGYKKLNKIVEKQFIKDKFKPQILKYKILGEYSDSEDNKIDVLLVALNNITTLQRTRTLQRNFIADYLSDKNKQAALVAFVTDSDAKEWRFSLVKLDSSLEVVKNKLKSKKEITPARRWSFIVGENEGSHTAQSRFINLLQSKEKPNLAEIESSFNIETVTKEFFDRYTELFFNLKEYLDKLVKNDKSIEKDFKNKEISTVDFAKKTLGQIVFLYFLQKKGWFGVPANKEWGSGPKRFIRHLFDRKEKYGNNFFNDILEPLFYEALAQDRGADAIYAKLNNVRMPFLNGGLFEPMNNYSWETTDIIIPNELFSNKNKDLKSGDIGNGILDVFDRYNFTVNENEPLEQEVAVDPEMLGKVFENLLDIKDRKSKGAFYTPREIVHYMCQETLINYLDNETENIPKIDIEFFIRDGELILENDQKTASKIKEKVDIGYEYKGDYSFMLPRFIINSAEIINGLLYNIKVADPAVGSGAFPLGMLNEIVRARKVISAHIKSSKKPITLKKETIQNCLYGVDLDPGAVEIAKLRLWLSLVVDENKPHPLPNLDHKIMQGNSLVSEHEGIKLFDESLFPKIEKNNSERAFLKEKIKEKEGYYMKGLQSREFSVNDKNIEIVKELKQLKKDLKKIEDAPINTVSAMSLFDNTKEDLLDIINKKTEKLSQLTKKFILESQRTPKQNLKKEIDDLKWDLIEMTLKQQEKEDKLEEVKLLRKKNEKPFFIWGLEFADVFKENGGFDIVIGNPPYIMESEDKNAFIGVHDSSCYQGKTDLWHIFVCKGMELIKKSGHISYIAKNQWLNSSAASNMRKNLYLKTNLKQIVDFGSNLMFENADVQTMIFLAEKSSANILHKIDYRKFDLQDINNIKRDLQNNNLNFESKKIEKAYNETDNLTFSSSQNETILQKIDDKKNFEFDEKKEIIQGIIGAPDKYFIVKNEELKKFSANEQEYLKMLHTNTGRYSTTDTDKYMFYISKNNFNDKDINNFQNIKNHFEPYQEDLIKRKISYKTPNKPYFYLHRERDEKFFKDGAKLVWAKRTEGKKFTYTERSMYGTANLFFIKSSRVNLKYITALLNSKLMYFYMEERLKHTGDLLQIDKNQFMKIPLFVPKDILEIENLIDKILEITSVANYDPKNPTDQQMCLEEKIDQTIYKFYGLTDDEINIIEN